MRKFRDFARWDYRVNEQSCLARFTKGLIEKKNGKGWSALLPSSYLVGNLTQVFISRYIHIIFLNSGIYRDFWCLCVYVCVCVCVLCLRLGPTLFVDRSICTCSLGVLLLAGEAAKQCESTNPSDMSGSRQPYVIVSSGEARESNQCPRLIGRLPTLSHHPRYKPS